MDAEEASGLGKKEFHNQSVDKSVGIGAQMPHTCYFWPVAFLVFMAILYMNALAPNMSAPWH